MWGERRVNERRGREGGGEERRVGLLHARE